MKHDHVRRLGCAWLIVALGACSGTFRTDEGGDDGAAPPTPSGGGAGPLAGAGGGGQPVGGAGGDGDAELGSEVEEPGPAEASVMSRLTSFEYAETVRDLLGEPTTVSDSFPPDEVSHFFDNNAKALTLSPARAEAYLVAAESIAARAVSSTRLTTWLPCASRGDAACTTTLLRDFGKRAFRRPLTQAELTSFGALFDAGRSSGGFAKGVELVLRTMLISSPFLFRVEVGSPVPGTRTAELSAWELASRLSYGFWGTMPDAALFAAAEVDALKTPEQLAAQAERLLADPRARAVSRRFFSQWLALGGVDGLEKATAVFPKFATWVPGAYRREVDAYVEHAAWVGSDGGLLPTLFSSGHSFVDRRLAGLYGLSTTPEGTAFVRAPLDPARRGGLLTLGPVMANLAHANQTAPTLRGLFVRERLLCQPPPPPPPGVNNNIPEPDANSTTRERLAEHASNPSCAACHKLIDPIGWALENYDGAGLWRDQDNGKTIDPAGEATLSDLGGAFRGGVEIGRRLAASDMARACFARQAVRFFLGRMDQEDDRTVVESLRVALTPADATYKNIVLGVVKSPAFRTRLLASR